jgi:hypothetical protein
MLICSLGRKCIDNVLVDESGIAMRESVITQFVVDILLAIHFSAISGNRHKINRALRSWI